MGAQTVLAKYGLSSPSERRFIEYVRFPWREVSEASAVEKGPGRPPHWEMVFWWTRKPLISARAIIAGCLLPENTNPREFLKAIGIGGKSKSAHNNDLIYSFKGERLLDPFAGFGSIPLEAVRMDIDATAVELLPVAYVFLKAVLEYPSRYGVKLVEDVRRWGEWVTEKLREDPLISELYDEGDAVYIGSWEVKCPNCGKWTLLVGNWWLARVKGKKGYERLVWMEPKIVGEKVEIEVVDLNKMLGDEAVKEAEVRGEIVKVGGRQFKVRESNIEARRETATCLHCAQPIMQIDPLTGKHYTEIKSLSGDVRWRLKGYVKFALELYNKGVGYAMDAEPPSWINEIPARQRLLVRVKVKHGDFRVKSFLDEEDFVKIKGGMDLFTYLRENKDLRIDTLIIEGTNIGSSRPPITPSEATQMIRKLVSNHMLVIATLHPLDVEYAYFLAKLSAKFDLESYIASEHIASFLEKSLNRHLRPMVIEDYVSYPTFLKKVTLGEVEKRSVILVSYREAVDLLRDLVSTEPTLLKDATAVISESEPKREEAVEYSVFANWFLMFGVQHYMIRASGHYYPYELKSILAKIKPQKVISIHTESPKLFNRTLNKLRNQTLGAT